MHSASHPRGLMHISYVVLNFHLICTSWDFWIVGRPRQHNTHNCFAWVRHSFWTHDGAAREPRLSSCDQAQFLSFFLLILILIFGLVTSFPSRKAGLIMRRLHLALFRRRTRAVPIKFDCSTAIPRIQFRRRAPTAPTVCDVWSDTLLIHYHNLCFQFVHGSGTAFKCHNRVVRQNSSNFKGRFFQPSLF